MTMTTPTSDLVPTSIIVMTAANGLIINGLNGTSGVVMSLPSVLTTDSATITSLNHFAVITPSGTSEIVTSAGSVGATHKAIIIAVAVSLGLVCTVFLFIFMALYWGRKKVYKSAKSITKSSRSSLEIRCIGIESVVLTASPSPVPPIKAKATVGAPKEQV
ncbi:hypothetical protein V8C42DRAFT_336890 [Trichoderma barbatum]